MDLFKVINDTMHMLRVDEGERLFPYTDSEGLWTIGVGHCLDRNPIPGRTMVSLHSEGITKEESDNLLKSDIGKALKICIDKIHFFSDLDSVRQSILINMSFNLGNGLLKFKNMLAALGRGDYAEAQAQMIDSKWHGQVKSRALRLERMMLTGEIAEEYKL